MKNVILIFGLLLTLASCSTVRKSYNSNKVNVDSVTQTTKDTASSTDQTDIDISKARIEIDFDSAVNAAPAYEEPDTTIQAPVIKAINSIIKQARKSGAKKIIISADNFSDSSKVVQTVSKETAKTELKKTQQTVNKTVERKHLSIWVYVLIGLSALVAGVCLYIKYTPAGSIVSLIKKIT